MKTNLKEADFRLLIKMMNSICTVQIETNDTLTMYYELLKDLEYTVLLKAMTQLARTKENLYSPFSPAELIKETKKETNKELLLFADNLFNQIKLDIIKYSADKRPAYSKPIAKALEQIGGIGAISSATEENLFFLKRDFKKEISESSDVNEIIQCMRLVNKNKTTLLLKAP